MDPRLNQVALDGDIDALYLLIREDPYLLDRFDQIPFVDTPLHIAATTGHTDFAMEIMNLKPSFAKKLNPDGFSPLHLALKHGQTEMAFWLVDSDKTLARVKGREGMTALHYIAGTRDLNLLAEFLLVCPESIKDVNVRGETALHIAVKNNMFEALEVMLGWLQRATFENSKDWEKQLLNWRDKAGNTLLHIAAAYNQPKVVSLLLERHVRINLKNLEGVTAMDILESQSGVDNKKTKYAISRAGGLRSTSLPPVMTLVKLLRSKVTWLDSKATGVVRRSKDISSETRNAFLIVVILAATMYYQPAFGPPDGGWPGAGGGENRFLSFKRIILWIAIALITFLLSYEPSSLPIQRMLLYFCCFVVILMLYIRTHNKDSAFEAIGLVVCMGIAIGFNAIITGLRRLLGRKPQPRWKRSTQTVNENKVWWQGLELVSSFKSHLISLMFLTPLLSIVTQIKR